MLRNDDRLINEINRSTQRWKRQGHQRRFSVTDLHGIEYQASMGQGVPAQFYTSISYDFDRFSHWWFKIIVNPYELKAITEGNGVNADTSVGFSGNGTYNGSAISYGGRTLSASQIDAITRASKEYGILPSGAIAQLYLESNWGASQVGQTDNNWGGITWTGSTQRPSGVTVSQGMARPANEGGYYNHYNSVEDFMKDYMYMLARSTAGNNAKLYAVQGKTTIEDYTKGLFRVGGALGDYAEVGYDAYLPVMLSIYNGVNSQNNDFFKKIDDQVLNGQVSGNNTSSDSGNDSTSSGGNAGSLEEEGKATDKTQAALTELKSLLGQSLGSGECYAVPAYYSMILGGPGLGGGVTGITDVIGDTMAAANIGTGYDWAKYGWQVVTPQSTADFKVGAIVTLGADSTNSYGHVSVIEYIDGDTLTVLEQNVSGRRYVMENTYNAQSYLNGVNHIIYPPEIAEGGEIIRGSGGSFASKVVKFPSDITVTIDGIDFTPMFKAQFGGEWINKYAVFPNDKPNEGYDVMLAAAGLTEEQQKLIYTSGEHLVEINGSMQADVILRVYLKYNHLN